MNLAYESSASEIGLVFMTFGVTYTAFTPVFGFLTDKGLDGLITCLIGNSLIAVSFLILGPIPPLSFLGSSLWMTYLAIGVQGLGSSATYIGALLYMMKSARESGLPETDQTNGMVSSLWVVADCIGGVIGLALGGVAFDTIGFEWGSMAMVICMTGTVILISVYFVKVKVYSKRHQQISQFNLDSDEIPELLMNEKRV